MRAMRLAIALPCSLLVVAACARPGRDPGQTPRPPIKACELLTLEEADPQGALGLSPVGNAVDAAVGTETAKCSYGTVDLPVKVVSLEVRRFADAGAARSAQRAARGMLRGLAAAEPEDLSGLGDAAAWAGGQLDQLHLQDGDTRLIVTVEVGDEATRSTRARAIAAQALARLGSGHE